MTASSRIRMTASRTALTAVLGAGALAGTASAATIGQPTVHGPSERIPINFAGFKEPGDRKLPKNFRMVKVKVDIARGERASVVLTAPKGFRAVTIGMGDGHQIGGVVNDVDYPGKRSVRVKLWANSNLVERGETGHGTVYLLAKRA
jgi:hypothetical protein